jgi:hypothetical protein
MPKYLRPESAKMIHNKHRARFKCRWLKENRLDLHLNLAAFKVPLTVTLRSRVVSLSTLIQKQTSARCKLGKNSLITRQRATSGTRQSMCHLLQESSAQQKRSMLGPTLARSSQQLALDICLRKDLYLMARWCNHHSKSAQNRPYLLRTQRPSLQEWTMETTRSAFLWFDN